MGRACYHARPTGARSVAPLLERAHRFLTTRDRATLEAAADRFFGALGYRRRADADDGAIVFERGHRLAPLYSASLRKYETRLEVSADAQGTATVRHHVKTFPSLVFTQDRQYLDVEARAFERFLERGDIDVAEVVEAAQERATGNAWVMAAGLLLLSAAVAAIVGIVTVAALRLVLQR